MEQFSLEDLEYEWSMLPDVEQWNQQGKLGFKKKNFVLHLIFKLSLKVHIKNTLLLSGVPQGFLFLND